MATSTSVIGVVGRALGRPRLLLALLGAAWRFRRRGWWRHPPFLPIPPREYIDWRMHTAYGNDGRDPAPEELERYLRWANRTYRGRRRASGGP